MSSTYASNPISRTIDPSTPSRRPSDRSTMICITAMPMVCPFHAYPTKK
jgi:hypothetical protein